MSLKPQEIGPIPEETARAVEILRQVWVQNYAWKGYLLYFYAASGCCYWMCLSLAHRQIVPEAFARGLLDALNPFNNPANT